MYHANLNFERNRTRIFLFVINLYLHNNRCLLPFCKQWCGQSKQQQNPAISLGEVLVEDLNLKQLRRGCGGGVFYWKMIKGMLMVALTMKRMNLSLMRILVVGKMKIKDGGDGRIDKPGVCYCVNI